MDCELIIVKCFIRTWEQEKLKNVVERVTRKNNGKTDLPLTISAQDGLVDQRHYFKRQVASKNMDNYILIKKGEYAYNKSYSKDYPFGAIKMLKKYDYGALSTLYIVFKTINISPRFLESYYESHYWHKEINKIAAEGARNHGLLNLSTQDFFKTNIKIPSTLEEQLKISNIVNQLDSLITLHNKKRQVLTSLKHYYLNLFLSQNIFQIPRDDYKLKDISDITTGKLNANDAVKNGLYDFYTCSKDILKTNSYAFEGSALTVAGNGDVGHIKKAFGKFNAYQRTYVLQNIKSNFNYLYYELSVKLPRQILRETAKGVMPYIVQSTLNDLTISLPNEKSQENISSYLNILDQLCTKENMRIKNLEQLKKCYLNNLFI